MSPDRLDELETYRLEDDVPSDAKIRIPAGDLRDLVALIPVVRAAMGWRYWDEPAPRPTDPRYPVMVLERAIDELRKGRG